MQYLKKNYSTPTFLTAQSDVSVWLSDLLSLLQEAQQGCVVSPLLLLRPS